MYAFYRTVSVCLILAVPVPGIADLLYLSAVSLDPVAVVVIHSLSGCTGDGIICNVRLIVLQTLYFCCQVLRQSGKFFLHRQITVFCNCLGIFYHAFKPCKLCLCLAVIAFQIFLRGFQGAFQRFLIRVSVPVADCAKRKLCSAGILINFIAVISHCMNRC